MESTKATLIGGAQAITRSMQLLKLVSARADRGHLLAELVAQSGLTRPTVYRLLAALQAAGLIEQDDESGRWRLGAESYVLGTLAAPRFNLDQLARDSLVRLSDATGESSFLSIRRGTEAVCLVRQEGTYPIRTHVLQAGDRLPLGLSSAGIAILAALPDAEVEAVLVTVSPGAMRRYPGVSPKDIRQSVAETRAAGYAVNPGRLLVGSWGVAAVVTDASGAPIGALSLNAIESRIRGERQAELGHLLIREAKRLNRLTTAQSRTTSKRNTA
jgi:DNA-binding IclR family transcriptional regulator